MTENLPRIGSALLVRDEANRILLGKRNKDPQRGSWVIPGGKIHAFEKIAEAAARELREETGLFVEVGDHFNVYEIINPPNEHRIVIYSWGKVVGGEPKASDDISELKFFELDELGEVPVTPLVRRVLRSTPSPAKAATPTPAARPFSPPATSSSFAPERRRTMARSPPRKCGITCGRTSSRAATRCLQVGPAI